jgi:homoserine dehydrogenase
VHLVIITHEGPDRNVSDALAALAGSDAVLGRPMLMHILDM